MIIDVVLSLSTFNHELDRPPVIVVQGVDDRGKISLVLVADDDSDSAGKGSGATESAPTDVATAGA